MENERQFSICACGSMKYDHETLDWWRRPVTSDQIAADWRFIGRLDNYRTVGAISQDVVSLCLSDIMADNYARTPEGGDKAKERFVGRVMWSLPYGKPWGWNFRRGRPPWNPKPP